jgi:ABC-type methionine transport system permease subunit
MCALVDPAKLRYLEQIGLPCEVSLGGVLTAESERDVRNRTITSVDIVGDNAVAHTTGTGGPRDLALHRSVGHWLIIGV